MEVKHIEWEEINDTYYKGVVNQFELFFIFQNGVDDFLLETILPLPEKKYTDTSVKFCQRYAQKILRGFVFSCIKID